jgi:CRP-like cAMP-binding protein
MVQTPTNSGQLFKRGQAIYKAGDAATHIYLVQSGLVSVNATRQGTVIEVSQVIANHILGEEALSGATHWSLDAVANNDVRLLPIPLAQARKLLDSGPALLKVYSNALLEKQKAWSNSLLDIKLESDPTPCPASHVVKLFAALYHTATYTGDSKNGVTKVVWPTFKKYAQRVFLESPVRLEQAVNILVKLGYARLEMIPCETDPDAPDELGFVHFSDLDRVRSFFEFYRGHYFSAARGMPASRSPGADETNLAILSEIESWNALGKVEMKAA